MNPLLSVLPLRDGLGPLSRLAVVGCGYVGLVSGACFAEMGHEVICLDADADRIAQLRAGRCPIFEPGLPELLARNAAAGRLRFECELPELDRLEAVFLAVGTPAGADGAADLASVFAAVEALAPRLPPQTVVVAKSTVPPGTGDAIEAVLRARPGGPAVSVASNPEFMREGSAIADFLAPDRIVLGCQDEHARNVLEGLYRPLAAGGAALLITDRRTAELVKYASNAFLAVKISFINEMADLCEAVGADVGDVARGMGLDGRIGPGFLEAGPGYGGSCFPKDISALLTCAQQAQVRLRLTAAAAAANRARQAGLAGRVAEALGGEARGRRVAVLGLAFKPRTDDLRESPALQLVDDLLESGAEVSVYDPQAMPAARRRLPEAEFASDPYACAGGADAVVLATHWPELVDLDLRRLAAVVRDRVFVDLRGAMSLDGLRRAGFRVTAIGRRADVPPAAALHAAE